MVASTSPMTDSHGERVGAPGAGTTAPDAPSRGPVTRSIHDEGDRLHQQRLHEQGRHDDT